MALSSTGAVGHGAAQPELLVLRALGLGDLLTAVPALRGLRAAFPGHRLTLAAPAPLEWLARHAGVADQFVPTDGLRGVPAPTGSPRRPAIAVNLHGRGPQSHTWLAAHLPARMIAFAALPDYPEGPPWDADGSPWDAEGPPWDADESPWDADGPPTAQGAATASLEVARWCRLIAAHGIPADLADLRLDRPPAAPAWSGAVLVHPGAASAARRWPAARFAEVARALALDGHRVAVTGGPGEEALAGWVAAEAGVELAHGMDLLELVALVADAPLVVCGDTGLGHVATATGTPSVLLFGPSGPAAWGPPPQRSRHLVLWGGATGDPGGGVIDPGLARITVTDVLGAARTQLRVGFLKRTGTSRVGDRS